MNKNKKPILLIVGALLLVSVITGISYALWSITRVQTNPNEISSGCFSLEMVDGETLELSNAYPITEEQAMKKEGYTFQLKNTCTIDAKVSIKLLIMNDSTMALNHVNANLNGDTVIPSKMLSSMENGTTTTSNVTSTKVMGTIYVPGNTTKEYELRLWMDENVTTEEEQNTVLNAKVEVEATTAMVYADASGANAPELNNGLIPVVYNEDKSSWEIANPYNEWYNYTEQKWANAVTVKESVRTNYTNALPGTQVPMNDINTMWVWIPRYSYAIKSEDGTHYYGNLNGNVTYCKDIESPDEITYPSCYEYEVDGENKQVLREHLMNSLLMTESEAKEFEDILYRDKYEALWGTNTLKSWLDEAGATYQISFHGENIANYNILQPAAIDIKFENGTSKENGTAQYTGNTANNWLTNPAFTFGTQELTGMWVAKFEMSTGDTTCTAKDNSVETDCDLKTIAPSIIPNVTSWRGARVGTFFTAIQENMNGRNGLTTYGLFNNDTHMMKNMEWGAVAYLSQSKYGKYGNASYIGLNKEVVTNNCQTYMTGISGDALNTGESSATCTTNTYETAKGQEASTTGNIYGVYDMSGGAEEYVMGVMKESTNTEPLVGPSENGNSGFSGKLYDGTDYTGTYGNIKDIDNKYYDQYEYYEDTHWLGMELKRGMLGDGTKEVIDWYSDYAYFVYSQCPWFVRGSSFIDIAINVGIFSFNSASGNATTKSSARSVLITPAR